MPTETLDVLIALAACLIAWRLLADPDVVRAAALFIAFGLLLALAWVRLDAPDIAIAEAALGAGVTGLLVLDAAAATTRRERLPPRQPEHRARGIAALIAAAACAVGLAGAILALPGTAPGLRAEVAGDITRTGVEHPVTAVLLASRAWDTLLEVAVLLVAVMGVLALRRDWSVRLRARQPADPLLAGFARIVAPVFVLVAGYLLWRGTSGPGGAFQAGAVLSTLLLIMVLAGIADPARIPGGVQRGVLVAGTAVFAVVALTTAIVRGTLLELPRGAAYDLILIIETAIAVSVGAALAALVLLARPPRTAPDREEQA